MQGGSLPTPKGNRKPATNGLGVVYANKYGIVRAVPGSKLESANKDLEERGTGARILVSYTGRLPPPPPKKKKVTKSQ